MLLFSLLLPSALAKPKDCVPEAEVAALRARIADLEAQVQAAEARADAAEARALTAPTAYDPAREQAATEKMDAVSDALTRGDMLAAKQGVAELVARYPETRAGKAAARMNAELSLVGTPAPPITVEKWFQGQATYADSPVTLVVFFEAWCPHCKNELPRLAQEEAALATRGIRIVAVTRVTKSATDETVAQFLADNAIHYAVGKETGSMTKDFAVTGIPAAALVKDGVVIWRGHPARLDDTLLTALLGPAH